MKISPFKVFFAEKERKDKSLSARRTRNKGFLFGCHLILDYLSKVWLHKIGSGIHVF
jgi:hypothetical protein